VTAESELIVCMSPLITLPSQNAHLQLQYIKPHSGYSKINTLQKEATPSKGF